MVFPGESGGMRDSDTLRLAMLRPGNRASSEGPVVEVGRRSLTEGLCLRAAWSDEGLRELEVARQHSVPGPACRLSCPEPVPADRIAWTEAAGPKGEVRTIEAEVMARTGSLGQGGHRLELRVIEASGPGAPEAGSRIERTADAVTARGCFRAAWSDEARRESISRPGPRSGVDPPARERTREQEQTREQRQGRGRGLSM